MTFIPGKKTGGKAFRINGRGMAHRSSIWLYMKKIFAFMTRFIISLSVLMAMEFPLYAVAEDVKLSLAVYPFNDLRKKSLDMDIYDLLSTELSGYEFIRLVPVEVIREKLYEFEPQFMWTEKNDEVKRGGILWKIESGIVEKTNKAVNAQYSLYGDLMGFGKRWRVDAYLVKEGETDPVRRFSFNGMNYEEMPAKLTGMSKSIAQVLKGETVLNAAEEDIRQYKGGMVSYEGTIVKIKKHIVTVPESVPLRALLLDLHLEDKDLNQEDILIDGLKIISMIKDQESEGMRYMLSLALDPFDSVAQVYEVKKDWDNAINIRDRALNSFPLNPALHKEGIGRNYYYIARSFDEKGMTDKAVENYKTAVFYLQPSTVFYKNAMDGIRRLEGKGVSSK
ncbi:MAG: hypothetical protein C4581_10475 [Nitrospiraceae bacterium]|nr:MAG: hypothetical protein C4581_10475 [Nitrospiraceae bacterium]